MFQFLKSLTSGKTFRDSNLEGYTILEDVSDGARIKYWVTDGKDKYLYKENKKHSDGSYTYENYSEYLTYLICTQIGVPCVDIILKDNAVLSKVMVEGELSSFIELSEEFSHSFHMSNLTTFNISTLLNEETNPYKSEVIEMLLLDALIGNSDRHPGNFMYSEKGFYPLFDNGSALLAYIEDKDIVSILRDFNRFNAICTTKSKPVVRDNQKLTHLELVEIIRNSYPEEFEKFQLKLSRLDLVALFESFIIVFNREFLLKKFLEFRLEWFK